MSLQTKFANFLPGNARLSRRLALAAVGGAALLAAACSGDALKPEAEFAGWNGPPMWVIADEDSTIYLTGTVHLLKPDTDWRSERLVAALDDAEQLWLEVALDDDIAATQAAVTPFMLKHALSPGVSLSSRLTEEDNAALAAAMERAGITGAVAQGMQNLKPWVVALQIGFSPLAAAGYDNEAGIDVNLARMARQQGDTVHGFESLEQQIEYFASTSDEDQLAALRAAIYATPEEIATAIAESDAAFTAWAAGDPAPLTRIMATWKAGEDPGTKGMPYDTLVTNRNKDWAEQIEDMLAGSGVQLIAVGGGHTIGPDSVQEQLKKRGIEAKPY